MISRQHRKVLSADLKLYSFFRKIRRTHTLWLDKKSSIYIQGAPINMQKNVKKFLIPVIAILFLLASAFALYLNDYYHADLEAIAAFSSGTQIQTLEQENHTYFYPQEETHTGLIFYPGGKVEHTAYIPLMTELTRRGIFCVLIEMPFHLAVFDSDAADNIPAQFPEIDSWYLSGHSLGGAMASSYLSRHSTDFQGLILLGAYSASDLSDSNLSVLSLYGSEDLVLNADAYEESRTNLPEGFSEIVLKGGCHAGFGMYGPQDGDGSPTLSASEQIIQTADLITTFIFQQTPKI